MAEDKYNLKNPAVKRILQEVKEMQSNPSDDFMSLPLEENIFEWQFAIRGPGETEFEGGIYHGRIQLPAEYPFKPPSFMLLTPNGRFETQTKICLSISNHHPEHWQPSWSVRTALVALIAFMPTSPNGALGSLDYKKEERRVLAVKSREASPRFGTPERQKLIDEVSDYFVVYCHLLHYVLMNCLMNRFINTCLARRHLFLNKTLHRVLKNTLTTVCVKPRKARKMLGL
ncbi:hypothetical protein NC651_020326 [Populus alba x Populus x berolinensis]|nr:hypothetical protein NC651_020326 [Populus alba x Populus x berolinensis]